jgi:putative transposase
MLITERFLSGIVEEDYGKDIVSTDGGETWCPPQACRFLKLQHHLNSPLEKSMIYRTIQYIKDRTECLDDYLPCQREKYNFLHIRNWLNLFVKYA